MLTTAPASSPGRNVQRMGRTGRHGAGRIVYLLASGKEEREYAKNLQLAKSLDQQVRSGRFQLEQRSP